MIKFKIDGKQYVIPDYLSVEHYSKIYKIKNLFSDEYFAAKILNIVCGGTVEEYLTSDYQEVEYLASHILTLIPLETPKFEDRFELDGVHYGFFPKWEDLTFAEFVDLDTISTKKADELFDLLHILAAIMYRPIINQRSEHDFDIEKYDVETMKIRAELFKKKMNVRYVLGAQHFFIRFVNRYLSYIRLSSIPKVTMWMKVKLIWKMRKLLWGIIFKKRLDGSLSQTELLEMTLQSMNMSTKKK
jgi:hypothetical protein